MRTIAFVVLWTATAFLTASLVKANELNYMLPDELFTGAKHCVVLDKTTNPWRLRSVNCSVLKKESEELGKLIKRKFGK